MTTDKMNGNGQQDPRAAANAAYAAALHAAATTVKLLAADLAELDAAAKDLGRFGVMAPAYPLTLARAVQAQTAAWRRTDAGRAAMGLGLLPTRAAQLLAEARLDVTRCEERLEKARAIANVPELAKDRRKVIEDAALALVAARRRVAELDPGALAAFRAWAKNFGLEVRRWLQEPSTKTGEGLDRVRAEEAEAARREDPLGAALARIYCIYHRTLYVALVPTRLHAPQ